MSRQRSPMKLRGSEGFPPADSPAFLTQKPAPPALIQAGSAHTSSCSPPGSGAPAPAPGAKKGRPFCPPSPRRAPSGSGLPPPPRSAAPSSPGRAPPSVLPASLPLLSLLTPPHRAPPSVGRRLTSPGRLVIRSRAVRSRRCCMQARGSRSRAAAVEGDSLWCALGRSGRARFLPQLR